MGMGIYSSLSGMKIKEQELDLVAHNVANANTTGFKQETIAFKSVLAKHQGQGAVESGVTSTPFSIVGERTYNFEPGAIISTSSDLDLAIQGSGFFEVQSEKGTFYTRNGAFTLNPEGEMVTTNGEKVMGAQGAIKITPGQRIQISTGGRISVDGAELGELKVISFDDAQKLEAVGKGYFRASEGANGRTSTDSTVLQGKLEQSNTNIMAGLVKLIEISREYQTYQKILSSQSNMDSQSATSLGKVG